jgi:hypothetical protein
MQRRRGLPETSSYVLCLERVGRGENPEADAGDEVGPAPCAWCCRRCCAVLLAVACARPVRSSPIDNWMHFLLQVWGADGDAESRTVDASAGAARKIAVNQVGACNTLPCLTSSSAHKHGLSIVMKLGGTVARAQYSRARCRGNCREGGGHTLWPSGPKSKIVKSLSLNRRT